MTLALTELSNYGIAMAADSAVTYKHPRTEIYRVISNAAQKLQVIPPLNAGISCWGLGTIADVPTDQWLSNFIDSSTSLTTLQSFADELARQLNAQVSPDTPGRILGENNLGFHLAGFEDYNRTPTPSFYHMHDGPSEALQQRGINVNPNQFNANHDLPPQIFHQKSSLDEYYTTRNGDYKLYAQIFDSLNYFFNLSLTVKAKQATLIL